jgi:two-component system chemotaxis response regulator CheB
MKRIRVLVAEDSISVRRHLVETLASDPELTVVGEASTGQQAVDLAESLRPDIITLDMMMPVMNGLAATEHIMAYCPTPILIVSSSVNRGEAFRTFDALSAGAIDVLEKPAGTEPPGVWERRLIAGVKTVSKIKVITHPRAKLMTLSHQRAHVSPQPRPPEPPPVVEVPPATGRHVNLVVMGASTGGPSTVAAVLKALPADFPLPILLVIHISPLFAQPLVDWLASQSSLPVQVAVDGQKLTPGGKVLMAPPDRHLCLDGDVLRAPASAEVNFCRPSVDVLFRSVARDPRQRVLACLLTGMGRDGAEGLLAIRRGGGLTIAESEATAIVFGMPSEAIQLGAVHWVEPLSRIAGLMVQIAAGQIPQDTREAEIPCR